MQLSNEIIKVLEYLGEKIGITIDWTSNNAIPYLEQLCSKFIKCEIGTSIGWIVFMFILVIITFIFSTVVALGGFEILVFWCVVVVAIIVVGYQAFDIIECYTFPEKAIYEYISEIINRKG